MRAKEKCHPVNFECSDDEFQFLTVREQTSFKARAEKTADGFASFVAVIERPMVDIHADEFIGEVAAHVAGILQCVLHGFGTMIEAELDAGRKRVGNFLARRKVEFFIDDIAAERQRQAVIFLSPPNAQIFADDESFVFVGELAFVNDEADIGRAAFHGLKNLIERHDNVIEFLRRFAEPELQGKECAGHGSRHGNLFLGNFFARKLLFCHEHRAIAVAHARAAGQQGVFVGNVGVGVDADGGDVEFAARGAFVQRLDVLQNVLKMKTVCRDQSPSLDRKT